MHGLQTKGTRKGVQKSQGSDPDGRGTHGLRLQHARGWARESWCGAPHVSATAWPGGVTDINHATLFLFSYVLQHVAHDAEIVIPDLPRYVVVPQPCRRCVIICCPATSFMGECNNCGDKCAGPKCEECQKEYDRRIYAGICTQCGENRRNLGSGCARTAAW